MFSNQDCAAGYAICYSLLNLLSAEPDRRRSTVGVMDQNPTATIDILVLVIPMSSQ